MNDLVVQQSIVIPVVWRMVISAVSNKLKGTDITGWDSNFWNLPSWYREG
jgi:peptide/nickel transport system substrate-binding protein